MARLARAVRGAALAAAVAAAAAGSASEQLVAAAPPVESLEAGLRVALPPLPPTLPGRPTVEHPKFASEPPAAPEHPETLQVPTPPELPAVQTPLGLPEPVVGVFTPPALPPRYECTAEYYDWKDLWTEDWKEWCCKHERRGCPSTTTQTVTTTTLTTTETTTMTSTKTTTVTTTTTDPEAACETSCVFEGLTATCTERVKWAVKHNVAGSKRPCQTAHALVLAQCSMCQQCTLAAAEKTAGCELNGEDSASPAPWLLKKYEDEAAAQGAPEPAAASSGSPVAQRFLGPTVLGAAAAAAALFLAAGRRRALRRPARTLPLPDEDLEGPLVE